jgi:hypothetical protein
MIIVYDSYQYAKWNLIVHTMKSIVKSASQNENLQLSFNIIEWINFAPPHVQI